VELDYALKNSFEELKNRLDQTENERRRLEIELKKRTEEVSVKEHQIEGLKKERMQAQINEAKQGINTASTNEREDLSDELRKLRMDLANKDGDMDIQSMRIDELTKINKNLQADNSALKEQILKRKEKVESEMSGLYTQLKELEIKKLELERNQSDVKNVKDSQELNSKVVDLKLENKQLADKLKDLKTKLENSSTLLKNEVFNKESRIKELELVVLKAEKEAKEKSDSLTLVKAEYEIVKHEIEGMKMRVDMVNKNSTDCEGELYKMKMEFDNNVKKKDMELKDLKANLEMNTQLVERAKKMEKALKNELANKDEELEKRQEMISEIRAENDRLHDEILLLKKETFGLQSKLEVMDTDHKYIVESSKDNEIKFLKENERKYKKLVKEMDETLKKKQKILDNKKKMNLLLVDLAKVKKGEVQCIETLQITGSNSLRETLGKLREQEKEIISR
jgi:chromosome segregation ATPase